MIMEIIFGTRPTIKGKLIHGSHMKGPKELTTNYMIINPLTIRVIILQTTLPIPEELYLMLTIVGTH